MTIEPAPSRLIGLSLAAGLLGVALSGAQPSNTSQPAPPVVTPGPAAGAAPSDAQILFDGAALDQWASTDGTPVAWRSEGKPGGSMTVGPGSIITRKKFGDCQLHLEFAEPTPATGDGQGRGNSGVYLQGRYEVQVLDSFKNSTYPNGQCGAIYGQHVPLVNACRPPGDWQTYDIVFHAARFEGDKVKAPARFTVFHNGVLIQDNVEVRGVTGSAPGKEGPDDAPIYLQDHGNPVKYRNIWVRELK